MIILLVVVAITVAVTVIAVSDNARAFVARMLRPREEPADIFVCKLRPGGHRRWPRRRCRAVWVHDVLLVKCGRLFPRTQAFPVRLPEDVIRQAAPSEVCGLGRHPLVITLRLDDGPLVDLAAAESDRTQLVGPFLAAAIPGLRAGRRERPGSGR